MPRTDEKTDEMTSMTNAPAPRSARGRSPATPIFALAPVPSRAAQGLRAESHDVWLYLAGSTALRGFLKPLGATAYKIGTSSRRDVQDRILDLRRKRYAGLFGPVDDPNAPGHRLAKAHEWFMSPILPAHLGGADLPTGMRLDEGALQLALPSATSLTDFDEAVRAMLRSRALDAFLAGPDGRRRLQAVGLDPAHALVTEYDLIGRVRRSRAQELYLIRPMKEMPALVPALSQLVAGLAR